MLKIFMTLKIKMILCDQLNINLFMNFKNILIYLNLINKKVFYILYFIFSIYFSNWGLGIGDWGLGIGDWAHSPLPNPQSPIPNPQSPY